MRACECENETPYLIFTHFSPQIVSAVHYCHEKNIVHRDLKVCTQCCKQINRMKSVYGPSSDNYKYAKVNVRLNQ